MATKDNWFGLTCTYLHLQRHCRWVRYCLRKSMKAKKNQCPAAGECCLKNVFECAMPIIMDVWCDSEHAISISDEGPGKKSRVLSVYKLFLHDLDISVNIFWRGMHAYEQKVCLNYYTYFTACVTPKFSCSWITWACRYYWSFLLCHSSTCCYQASSLQYKEKSKLDLLYINEKAVQRQQVP